MYSAACGLMGVAYAENPGMCMPCGLCYSSHRVEGAVGPRES